MFDSVLNQPILTAYLVLAAFLIGSGVFFDRIAGEVLKKNIASYLDKKASFKMDLTQYTKYFVFESITKFFHGDVLTWRNFKKASLISLSSLTFVICLYAIKNDQNPLAVLDFVHHENPYMHALALALVLGSVLLGDIFSILQTALLLNLIGSIRSAYDVLFLLICDLIITINIFVFALPLGLQWATVANDIYGVDLILGIQAVPPTPITNLDPIKDEALRSLITNQSYRGAITFVVASKIASDRVHTVPEIVSVTYKNADPTEVIREMMDKIGSNVRDVPKLQAAADDSEFMSIILDKPTVLADVHLSNHLTFQGVSNTYGLMFVQSRLAQNVFPMVASLQPVLLGLGDVYVKEIGWTRIPHELVKTYYVKCDDAATFSNDVPNMSSCTKAAIVKIGDAIKDTYVWNDRANPFLDKIPISPLAFSCLFMTFAFYALMLISFAMIKATSLMHVLTFSYRYVDIEKSTFAVMAAFVCVLLIPIFAIAFAFHKIVLT